MTPGERLQRLLDAKGWTQEEAARELDVSRKTINTFVNGRTAVTAEMAVRLETVFAEGPTAGRWLALQARADLEAARSRLARWARLYEPPTRAGDRQEVAS